MGRMTRTVNGSVASFKSPGAVPIRSLKAYFTPIQNGSGDPSPSNIRPISGHNGITVYKGEENLFPANEYTRTVNGITFAYRANGDVYIKGTSTANVFMNVPTSMYFTITPGIYTLSGNTNNSNVNVYVVVSSENGGDIKWRALNNNAQTREIDFTDTQTRVQISVSSGRTVDVTVHPCLKRGSEASKIESIPIEFPNGTTVYGGHVDLITGNIVAEWAEYTFTGQETIEKWNLSTPLKSDNIAARTTHALLPALYIDGATNAMCNMAVSVSNIQMYYGQTTNGICVSNTGRVTIQVDGITTLEDMTAWLTENKPTCFYKLAVPVEYSLAPFQLKTLFGQNNIWCNADSVEVTYDFAESTDIAKRKHLFFNEPHDASALGDIASFETDMIGKLKSATFGFEPIQNGSGDPSPENVRPINGYNAIDINFSGKNLFDIDTFADGADLSVSSKRGTLTYNASSKSFVCVSSITGNYTIECHVKPANHVMTFANDKTLRMSYKVTNGKPNSGNYLRSILYFSNGTNTAGNSSYADGYYKRTVTIPANTYITDFVLFASYTGNVAEGDIIVFSEIQFEIANAETSYEEYKGETIPIEFPVSGKNLFNASGTTKTQSDMSWIVNADGTVTVSGTPTGYSQFYFDDWELPSEGTLCLSGLSDVTNVAFDNTLILDENKATIGQIDGGWISYRSFSVANYPNAKYIRVCCKRVSNNVEASGTIKIMLEYGTTPTTYEPYTTTIYGGYVDPIKGEIVAEWVKLPLKNQRWYNFSNFKIFGLHILKDKTTSIFSDSTPIIANRNPSADDTIGVYTNGADYAGDIYYYKDAGFTTGEEFNTYINGLSYDPYIVFKAQTPIHYPINQINLKTFKGINNFWSSGNGETGIVYWTHK